MQTIDRPGDWRSILLLIFSLSSAFLALSTAAGFLVLTTLSQGFLTDLAQPNASPLSNILLSSSLAAIGLLLLPAGWLSLQRLRGKESVLLEMTYPAPRTWIILLILWLLVMGLGTAFQDAPERRGISQSFISFR